MKIVRLVFLQRSLAQGAKVSTMVTSTPRTTGKKVPKSKKKRENELKEELAKIEIEKSLLQVCLELFSF